MLNLFIHLYLLSDTSSGYTLSIRHLKLDVPMPTQIRHCKKKLFSYHQAGNLEAVANFQSPLHCHSPSVRCQTLPCPLPWTPHLAPFFFLPVFRVCVCPGHLMSEIPCLHLSLSFLILLYECPTRGLTRTSFYTQVQVLTCQPPSLPPTT